MRFVFIDDFKFEIRSGSDKGSYFGLSFVSIDSSKYNKFRKGLNSFLKKTEWPLEVEFKGRYFFDGKGLKGELQEMWKTKHSLIKSNISLFFDKDLFSGKNKKMSLSYVYQKGDKNLENYKKVLLKGVEKCLSKKTSSKEDKNYCLIFVDNEDSFPRDSFYGVFSSIKVKTVILENNLNFVYSSNYSPGIQLADIFAYFAKWYLSDDEEIHKEINLFDSENQKLKKGTYFEIKGFLETAKPNTFKI